jgi:uncharacterized protein (TIGR00730 family)
MLRLYDACRRRTAPLAPGLRQRGRTMKRVCVFCGSRHGTRPAYTHAAEAMGRELAVRGLGLVYGGGHVGLMGVVADAALAAGAEATGVIPHALAAREVDHPGLTALHTVNTMHERKALMADLSDAFVALPGGIGTLEEIMEVWTWAYLGIHRKPVGLLNVEGYFDPLLAWVERATADGFLRDIHRDLLVTADEPGALLDALAVHDPPRVLAWLDRSGR